MNLDQNLTEKESTVLYIRVVCYVQTFTFVHTIEFFYIVRSNHGESCFRIIV